MSEYAIHFHEGLWQVLLRDGADWRVIAVCPSKTEALIEMNNRFLGWTI